MTWLHGVFFYSHRAGCRIEFGCGRCESDEPLLASILADAVLGILAAWLYWRWPI